ncbi:hypothetical protein B0H21DRAFT_781328 [Amylocystis lapponica]|nr:hypothetical protein B0H21DRAFT_781328 [Amylocystis lapponica]
MDNPQYYQPLSHALQPPIVSAGRSPQQQYSSYGSHAHPPAANGTHTHREEEEEEEEDDEEIVEEELEHNDQDPTNPPAPTPRRITLLNTSHPGQPSGDGETTEKRKPGRPRGSRNRKPRAPPGSSTKVPANSQHPGFYQYHPPQAQFYEFQWRALNLCSEFYNAAEELVKAASPIVLAQCYQMGPSTKIDPLGLITEAKRVCDNLLANPSQLVGNPPPSIYPMAPYPQMAPPPAPGPSATGNGTSGTVITNPQSFMYASPGGRYPTAPYYSYTAQPQYYAPPAQPSPVIATPPTSAAPAPTPPSTGTMATFNAATGTATPGGQQGTWSEEETERLRKLAEQSKEKGGPQNKGEIEWDWVVQAWGNSRTRHQILLKATSMGLKESTTRGTKRRREAEPGTVEASSVPAPVASGSAGPPQAAVAAAPAPAPAPAPMPHTPVTQPSRPPSSTPVSIAPARTTTITSPATANLPWPMPTVAANTPSPVLSNVQTDARTNNYYRPRPTQTTPYGTAAAPNPSASRPPSSHGSATHHYMYRPNGPSSTGRRDG